MTQIKSGNTVKLHYTGSLADGTVFDSSEGRDPLEFTVGAGQVIVGLDKALPGMEVGEKKVVQIPADEAYGPYEEDARQSVPRNQIPPTIELQEGMMLQMQLPSGQSVPVTVAELSEDTVVMDANHRLAGKDLTFAIEIVEIGEASEKTCGCC